jgi:hypothetical protein
MTLLSNFHDTYIVFYNTVRLDIHWIIVTFILLVIKIVGGYMTLYKRLFVNITRVLGRGLYCKQPFIYGHITCQQSLLRIYNTASIIFREKSKISS